MPTFYVIRRGWNAANQSCRWSNAKPKNTFESGYDALVQIVTAETRAEAVSKCNVSVYNGQFLYAVNHPRALKGLTREVREFYSEECEM